MTRTTRRPRRTTRAERRTARRLARRSWNVCKSSATTATTSPCRTAIRIDRQCGFFSSPGSLPRDVRATSATVKHGAAALASPRPRDPGPVAPRPRSPCALWPHGRGPAASRPRGLVAPWPCPRPRGLARGHGSMASRPRGPAASQLDGWMLGPRPGPTVKVGTHLALLIHVGFCRRSLRGPTWLRLLRRSSLLGCTCVGAPLDPTWLRLCRSPMRDPTWLRLRRSSLLGCTCVGAPARPCCACI